ncbi:MAG: PAS domain S-box-containing protein [Gammaproteobacteria bacterium]|jgi:PAS domain S-box-containing protein
MSPKDLPLANIQSKFAAAEIEQIFEAMADGVWVCDSTPTLLWVNSACEELNSIKREDVCGKSVDELLDSGNFDTDVTHQVLSGKESIAIIQKVKSNRTLLVNGTPIFDEQGKVKFVVGSERDVTELNLLKEQLEQKQALARKMQSELLTMKLQKLNKDEIISASEAMVRVMDTVLRVANFDTTVLLTGPSGAGKSMIAKLIHDCSSRRDKPFMILNCGAIPGSLAEAELFGYSDGAFTGAQKGGKMGLIEAADGGTLLLDEIDSFSLDVQVKLLTFLDTKSFIRVGSHQLQQVDVRLIAATNCDLKSRVEEGKFRPDLWYRLNVVPIEIPSLAERPDDIGPLITLHIKQLSGRYGAKKSVSRSAMDILSRYHYPGNVRELENILEHSYVLCQSDQIGPQDLPQNVLDRVNPIRSLQSTTKNLKQALDAVEREYLYSACKNCKTQADIGASLGTSQPSVARLLKKHGLRIESGKTLFDNE